jgi:hypothetical protein
MFSPDRLREAYGEYRESIGRPRTNTSESLENSIPFAHFVAGVEWTMKAMEEEGMLSVGDLFPEEENAEDQL